MIDVTWDKSAISLSRALESGRLVVAYKADGISRDADETIINDDMIPVIPTLNCTVSLPKPAATKLQPKTFDAY